MKTKSAFTIVAAAPLQNEIRDNAYHLYKRSGGAPGHGLDNWLEAKASILLNLPRRNAHNRLHRHLENGARGGR